MPPAKSSVTISSALLDAILAHAAADPEREVCGLLFGRGDGIEDAVAEANVSAHPTDSFELDPAALFAAMRAERGGGRALLGHYHSHPRGPARPSARDAAAAGEPGRLWLIVGDGEVTAWRAVPGGAIEGAFDPQELCVARAGATGQKARAG